jgi:hypothetical protein
MQLKTETKTKVIRPRLGAKPPMGYFFIPRGVVQPATPWMGSNHGWLNQKSYIPSTSLSNRPVAQAGITGPGEKIPYLDSIQRSFGMQDLTGIRAHQGSQAAAANHALGSTAYALGDDVSFSDTPTLHTAAHEAAHVVQQRSGISVQDGGSRSEDEHERRVDQIADRVASGESAAPLLANYAPKPKALSPSVQKKNENSDAASINQALLNDPIGGNAIAILNSLSMSAMLKALDTIDCPENTASSIVPLSVSRLDLLLGKIPSGLGKESDARMLAAIKVVKLSRARKANADPATVTTLMNEIRQNAAFIGFEDQKKVLSQRLRTHHPGANGMFPESIEPRALGRWDYVVYEGEIRLGNRKIGPDQVIGAWPWMLNNPGDLTVDLKKPKDRPMETFAFEHGAIRGVAARGDLAVFSKIETGYQALQAMLRTRYLGMTIADAARRHLGNNLVAGVDDPAKYAHDVGKYLRDHGSSLTQYSVLTAGLSDSELKKIADAFGQVEGMQNTGVIYTCAGILVPATTVQHAYVNSLPTDTPNVIRDMLGCI